MDNREKEQLYNNYRASAKRMVEQYNLKVGDTVKVKRAPTDSEKRTLIGMVTWNSLEMDRTIGASFEIKRFEAEYRNVLLNNGYCYPIHLLEPIKSIMPPETQSLQAVLEQNKELAEQQNFMENFDMERLAEEVDDMFQSKLEVVNNHFKDITKDQIDNFKRACSNLTVEATEAILTEIAKGRTVITLPNATTVTVEHMDHPMMEKIVVSVTTQKKAMLVGPAGTGKTFMVDQIAKRLKLPFYKYSCSRDSSVHDLLGYKQPASETYLETVFLKAYEQGGVFLVDEYDAMSGDMALFFNGIADGSKFISVPHRDDKPVAEKHKDFLLVMCGNTWGKGSHEFSGRDFQDCALMDRFRLCRHHVGYHHKLEQNLSGNMYGVIKDMRIVLESLGSYLSTRNVEDICNFVRNSGNLSEAIKMLSEDLLDSDKEKFLQKMDSHIRSWQNARF